MIEPGTSRTRSQHSTTRLPRTYCVCVRYCLLLLCLWRRYFYHCNCVLDNNDTECTLCSPSSQSILKKTDYSSLENFWNYILLNTEPSKTGNNYGNELTEYDDNETVYIKLCKGKILNMIYAIAYFLCFRTAIHDFHNSYPINRLEKMAASEVVLMNFSKLIDRIFH